MSHLGPGNPQSLVMDFDYCESCINCQLSDGRPTLFLKHHPHLFRRRNTPFNKLSVQMPRGGTNLTFSCM